MHFKMRLKSCTGLLLMFQLMINWFCLFIDASSPSIRVVCRLDMGKATNITDWYLDICTHVLLADNLAFNKDAGKEYCKLKLRHDAPKNLMEKGNRNPQLKVMLAIFINEFETFLIENRECINSTYNGTTTFQNAVVDFLKEMKFDGLDIRAVDYYFVMTESIKGIQKALKRNGFLFSLTLVTHRMNSNPGKEIEEYVDRHLVDFVNLVAFNYFDEYFWAYHQSPLFKNFPFEKKSRFLFIDDEIQKFKFVFEPAEKNVIGISLRSRSWTIPSNANNTRPPLIVLNDGAPGIFEKRIGWMSYREICHAIQTGGWQVFYEDVKRNISPYAVSPITGYNRTWVSYDDPATVVFKLKYSLSNELGGLYLDLAESDDFNNTCDLGPNPMFLAIARTLNITLP